jgi:hypothetical protein
MLTKTTFFKSPFILLVLVSGLTFSCQKPRDAEWRPSDWAQHLRDINIEAFNTEALRIFQDIQNADYHFGIIANLNMGDFFSLYGPHPYFSGAYPEATNLAINGAQYHYQSEKNLMFDPGVNPEALVDYFGADINLEIKIGAEKWRFQRYSPQIMKIAKVSPNHHINRWGTTITWDVDTNNQANMLRAVYTLRYANQRPKEGVTYIANNGSWSLDEIMDEDCYEVSLSISQRNTFAFTYRGKRYLFSLQSFDHHTYVVE